MTFLIGENKVNIEYFYLNILYKDINIEKHKI